MTMGNQVQLGPRALLTIPPIRLFISFSFLLTDALVLSESIPDTTVTQRAGPEPD